MSWLTAIAYFFIFSVLLRHPYILLIIVLIYVLRDRIPSPAGLFRRRRKISLLSRQVEVNPYDSTARRDLGMLLLDAGRPMDAHENLVHAYEKDPDSAEINHLLGLSLLRSGRPEKAEEHLAKAVNADPRFRYGESHLYLGEALLEQKKLAEALSSLEEFLSINNTSIEGKYYMARTLSELGQKDDATTTAEEGIRIHKGNPSFRRKRDWRWYVKLKSLRRKL